MTTAAARLVYGRVFDGLFSHGLEGQVTERLSRRLADELGVQLGRRMKASYPVADWERAVDIAAQELHPELPRAHAFELLGEALARGYFATPLGELARATLRILGPGIAMRRVEHMVSTANNYTESRVVERGPGQLSVFVNEAGPLGHNMCGAIRHALEVSGARNVRCAASTSSDAATCIEVGWDP